MGFATNTLVNDGGMKTVKKQQGGIEMKIFEYMYEAVVNVQSSGFLSNGWGKYGHLITITLLVAALIASIVVLVIREPYSTTNTDYDALKGGAR